MNIFTIKQNDTMPALEAQFLDGNGNPINLDMCAVRFHMQDGFGEKIINRLINIVDAAQGNVRVDWLPGETDTTGIYKCEFEITFTDGNILTIPNDGHFRIEIVRELG